uniref:Uncharacterized protein n=1 Tax=Ciona savignyi TaxID=51511 RepID=H2YVV9_CIOSA
MVIEVAGDIKKEKEVPLPGAFFQQRSAPGYVPVTKQKRGGRCACHLFLILAICCFIGTSIYFGVRSMQLKRLVKQKTMNCQMMRNGFELNGYGRHGNRRPGFQHVMQYLGSSRRMWRKYAEKLEVCIVDEEDMDDGCLKPILLEMMEDLVEFRSGDRDKDHDGNRDEDHDGDRDEDHDEDRDKDHDDDRDKDHDDDRDKDH